MNVLLLLIGVTFCLVNVSGRHVDDLHIENEENPDEETLTDNRDPTLKQMRHRRRSRQSRYDFMYHDYRRDYYRQKDDAYSQIIHLLEELVNLRQSPPPPPPPPQPIYVPYPVPYPVPQYMNCKGNTPSAEKANNTVDFFDRWPEMDDDNQNWGLVPGETEIDNGDGSRPISFDPILPTGPIVAPPAVSHGTTQFKEERPKSAPKRPGACKASILTCCSYKNNKDQQNCFIRYGCPAVFETGRACDPLTVKKVLDEFTKAYAPSD